MNPIIKLSLNLIGSVSLALGILGIFLPLLPTTPFLLLASACYLRGSERLHAWLIGNRFLGPYITNIREKKGMPVKAKIITIALLWASILFSVSRVEGIVLQGSLLLIAAATSTFILRMRTLRG